MSTAVNSRTIICLVYKWRNKYRNESVFLKYIISTRYLVSKRMGHYGLTHKSVTKLFISPMNSNPSYANDKLRDYTKPSTFFPKEIKIYSIFVFFLAFNLYSAFHPTSLSACSQSSSAGWYLSSEHLWNDGISCSPLKILFRLFLKNYFPANSPLTLLPHSHISARTTEPLGKH